MLSKSVLKFTSNSFRNLISSKSHVFGQKTTVVNNFGHSMTRSLVSDPKNFRYELPPLMDIDPQDVGSPLMRPLIINLYLRPFIDRGFRVKDFLNGSKQAVSLISSHLANGDIDAVKPLITKEAFDELCNSFMKFSPNQKRMLRVNVEDIIHCFPYSVKIERKSKNVTNVKIIVIFDVLNNCRDIEIEGKMSRIRDKLVWFDFKRNLKLMEPILDHKYICIYQFLREYKTGVDSEWIVNRFVHFKNVDILRLTGYLK